MKKPLFALTVLAAVAGSASAQSSVTIYGLFDIGLTARHSDTSATRIGIDSGNWYGSRIGFKGSEDLGGGLSAEFKLENGFNADDGTAGQGGRIFGRQSYVGLNGGFGSVKIGRQWIPAFTALGDVDPFEVGLAGDASAWLAGNIFNDIDLRMSNTINYSVAANGLSAVLAYGVGEVAGNSAASRQLGFTFAYTGGPFNSILTHHQVNNATDSGTAKATILGATYDFGPVMGHLAYDIDKTDAAGVQTYNRRNMLAGLTIPFGTGKVMIDYIQQDDRLASDVDSTQFALGYAYYLSKRTTVYTSYAHVNTNSVAKFNAGIRHTF